jgi:hypothetical protein
MDTFCICEVCREKVDPSDPDVLRAVEIIEVVMFESGPERVPGLTVFFHRDHYPSDSGDYELAAA